MYIVVLSILMSGVVPKLENGVFHVHTQLTGRRISTTNNRALIFSVNTNILCGSTPIPYAVTVQYIPSLLSYMYMYEVCAVHLSTQEKGGVTVTFPIWLPPGSPE